jgi:hypothetical protein
MMGSQYGLLQSGGSRTSDVLSASGENVDVMDFKSHKASFDEAEDGYEEEKVEKRREMTELEKKGDALFEAVRSESVTEVTALVKTAPVNWQNPWHDGSTALMEACSNNNVQLVQTLLRAKANPNLQDNHQISALSDSCQREHISLALLLLRAKADPALAGEQHTEMVNKLLQVNLDDWFAGQSLYEACGCKPEEYDHDKVPAMLCCRVLYVCTFVLVPGSEDHPS